MDLLAARLQMAGSLGFHIIFASIGIAMPFLMAVSHWLWLTRKEQRYLVLTKAWSNGVGIFFATGAVSGTVLSFELGLLWPKFMERAGPAIGLPFAWEGTAFFLEAIALGLFLYGWNSLNRWVHWCCGVVVGISGCMSALFVICANSWMNNPVGVTWEGNQIIGVDVAAIMFNRVAVVQGLHMIVAAFESTGFAVAGLHAFLLIKNPQQRIHLTAMKIALMIGSAAAIIQPLTGDLLAKSTAIRQPAKFAAMESLFETQRGAPLLIGGIPDTETRTVRFGIHIPWMLSFLAHNNVHAEVTGLDRIPREEWPPVKVVHFGFQIMVGIGGFLARLGLFAMILAWKAPAALADARVLKLLAIVTPLGFIALEAGWTVTEVGRQPWTIDHLLKTSDALTPMPGIIYSLIFFFGIYLFLSVLLIWLLRRQIRALHANQVPHLD